MGWVFKTEPAECSIDDIATAAEQGVLWTGVRNYQARNFLRDQTQVGDQVLIHHSSCSKVGIAGLAEVVEVGLVDPSQFEPESPYFDSKATPTAPRWVAVRVKFKTKFQRILTLDELRNYPLLQDMILLRKGNRLSVMPVSPTELEFILGLQTD